MALALNKRPVMTLFSGLADIFSHQVRIVLAEKGVTVDIEFVEQGNLPEDLIDLNPYHSVPTLVDRDLVLYNAQIIMEYLDERFPHPPLMPVYPVARGNSRLMMHRIREDWYTIFEKLDRVTPSERTALAQQLKEELLALSSVFSEFPFFMSEEFSLVDCHLAPMLWRLGKYGITLSEPHAKGIKLYMARLFERDTFLASLTDAEREMRLQLN